MSACIDHVCTADQCACIVDQHIGPGQGRFTGEAGRHRGRAKGCADAVGQKCSHLHTRAVQGKFNKIRFIPRRHPLYLGNKTWPYVDMDTCAVCAAASSSTRVYSPHVSYGVRVKVSWVVGV